MAASNSVNVLKAIKKIPENVPSISISEASSATPQCRGGLCGWRRSGPSLGSPIIWVHDVVHHEQRAMQLARNNVAIQELAEWPDDEIQVRDLTIVPSRWEVYLDGVSVHLTPNEYKILHLLMIKQGRLVKSADIVNRVWGNSDLYLDLRHGGFHILRVNMSRLRRRLGKEHDRRTRVMRHLTEREYIRTIPHVGYMLE